jgi:hypothetical protein
LNATTGRDSYRYGLVKRWRKRLAYPTAGLALLLVLVALTECIRGEWALSARLKALAVKGEALSLAELKPKRPAPDQNVFTDLLLLTNRLATTVSELDIAPPSLRLTSPGRAVVVAKLDEWSHDGETNNNWQEFGQGLEQARDILASLESAAQKPTYDGGIDYEKGFVEFQLRPIAEVKRSCQLLSWSVLYALNQGDLETAHKDLSALVTLIAKQTPEPLIICQLVRYACAAFAFNATWQALQADGWSDAQLASLGAAWQPCDFVKDMAFAMEMERAMTLDFYAQIRDSRKKLDFVIQQHQKTQEITDGAFGALPAKGFVLNWLYLPVWRFAWIAQDELASLEQSQFTIERERLARTNGWAALAGAKNDPKLKWRPSFESGEKLGWYDRLRFLFASENFSITDSTIRRTLEVQTQQQMVLTVLGIKRYRGRTGRLPAQLSELVPEYLAALPHDFMDGKALRYRLRPGDADFLLYSVGEDGKDDGGDPAQQEGKKSYRQIWDGRDAVWPSAATAEEANSALTTTSHD